MSDSRLLVGLCLSLLLSSLCISLITDSPAAELGDTLLYEPVAGNFSTQTGNPVAYTPDNTGLGRWVVCEDRLISAGPWENRVYFVIRWPSNAKFTNDYRIDSHNLEFSLIVRETGLFSDSIAVRVTPNGFYVETYELWGAYRPWQKFLAHPVGAGVHDYRVELDEPSRKITVYLDGDLVGTVSQIPEDSVLSLGRVRYSGVNVVGEGLEIYSLESSGVQVDQQSFDLWAFVSSVAGVVGWYTSSGVVIVDIFINLIIKIQQFGIAFVIVTLIRGN